MIKRMSLLTRKAGMTVEEFQRYWLEVHAPLAAQVPGILRYRQFLVREGVQRSDVRAGPAMPDGLTEIWYDSLESALNATAPERKASMADMSNFVETATTFFVEERPIVSKA